MTEVWKWASVKKVKEAADELKALILARYPEDQFNLSRAEDDRHLWHLWALVDVDDPDDVRRLTRDREVDLMVEEHVPLYVIPTRSRERIYGYLPEGARKSVGASSER
jgi:hypothetical protein